MAETEDDVVERGVGQPIFESLGSDKYDWRTISGVAKELNIEQEKVRGFIKDNSDLIVQSTIPSKGGESLYTTRKHFRNTRTVASKILGALKGIAK